MVLIRGLQQSNLTGTLVVPVCFVMKDTVGMILILGFDLFFKLKKSEVWHISRKNGELQKIV